MGDILDEAADLIQCKECPWYKSCVMPMRFEAEDLKRQIKSGMPEKGFPSEDPLEMIASAAQEMIMESCPVFIKRLRASRKPHAHRKKLMQRWG